MASIQAAVGDRGFRHGCGGSVIEKNLVLTAAHCMKPWKFHPMRVVFGSSNPSLDGPYRIERNIANVSIHPLYNAGKFYYDVAVLVLDEELDFNDRINKVCLPPISTDDGSHRYGHLATLTGWGESEPGSGATSELHQAKMEIFDEQYCNRSRSSFNNQGIVESDSLKVPKLFHSPVFCAGLYLLAFEVATNC